MFLKCFKKCEETTRFVPEISKLVSGPYWISTVLRLNRVGLLEHLFRGKGNFGYNKSQKLIDEGKASILNSLFAYCNHL